jgi:hypothetical protein
MENDDRVIFAVDPQGQQLTPYQFVVNPLGTQRLEVPAGAPLNVRWRGDWQAAAQRTPQGWSVEMRIPFRLLRYRAGQPYFGVALARHIPRSQAVYVFPQAGNFYDLRLQVRWGALELPRQRPPIVALPYLLSESDAQTSRSRMGIDLKWRLEQGQVALLTVNPDFSTIAADVASVDFSYTERFLRETRPFFTEGENLFPPTRLFYSVRVPQLRAGLKMFGQSGALEYGLLGGEYEQGAQRSRFTAGQTRYRLNPSSFLGVAFTTLDGVSREQLVAVEGAIGQPIVTLNYELTPEQVIGGRWVNNRIESGGTAISTNNFYLTYSQQLRTGQEVYLLFGLPNAARTQSRVALKIVVPLE